jgi:signal transduction histidine kinase
LEELAARTEREAVRERRLAAAEERTRIARELHDSAGHAVNVILVQAGAARLLHDRDPEGSRRAITTIEEVARTTLGEIDQLVRALRDDNSADNSAVLPVPADPAALDELLEHHRASGLTIATDVRGQRGGLPHSVTWAAYRILQEALTNAARHGHGSADVAVWFAPDAVEITVTNPAGNGSPPGGGHGIVGMRERATLLGGSLDARTDNGTFRLHARLPHTKAAS